MSRLTLGMFLIVASIIVLVTAVVAPLIYPPALQLVGSAFCTKDEQIVKYQRSTFDGDGGVAMGFECVNGAGQTRALSASLVLVVLGAFGIPFTLGLILVISGATSRSHRQWSQQPMVMGNVLPINNFLNTSNTVNRTYQLDQLARLRQAGVISQEDFEKACTALQNIS
jgi:hypothetical protein